MFPVSLVFLMRDKLKHDKDFTLRVADNTPAVSGYAIGLGRVGARAITIPSSSTPDAVLNACFEAFVQNVPLLVDGEGARAGACLGGWDDGEKIVLEPSEVVADRKMALAIAAERGEEAIYDLAAGETIYVSDAASLAQQIRQELALAQDNPLHPWHTEEVL